MIAFGCDYGDSEVAGFAIHFRAFHAIQSLYLRSQFRRRYADWQGVSPGTRFLARKSGSLERATSFFQAEGGIIA